MKNNNSDSIWGNIFLCVLSLLLIYVNSTSEMIHFQRTYLDSESEEGKIHVVVRNIAFISILIFNSYFLIKKICKNKS